MTGRKIRRKRKEPAAEKPPQGKEIILRQCSARRAILVAVLLTVIGFVAHTAEAMATVDYYADPGYAGVWSGLMMAEPGPPPAEFTYLSLAYGFVTALIFIWAYKLVEPGLIGADGYIRKGVLFGLLLFLVGTLPGALSLHLLINLPSALIAWWAFSGLVIAIIDGIVIAKLC